MNIDPKDMKVDVYKLYRRSDERIINICDGIRIVNDILEFSYDNQVFARYKLERID